MITSSRFRLDDQLQWLDRDRFIVPEDALRVFVAHVQQFDVRVTAALQGLRDATAPVTTLLRAEQ